MSTISEHAEELIDKFERGAKGCSGLYYSNSDYKYFGETYQALTDYISALESKVEDLENGFDPKLTQPKEGQRVVILYPNGAISTLTYLDSSKNYLLNEATRWFMLPKGK